MRPAIVLYGEQHPYSDDIAVSLASDLEQVPDMVIIIGTSLKVPGFKSLVKELARCARSHCPSLEAASTTVTRSDAQPGCVILVNHTPPPSGCAGFIDFHVVGDADKWSEKVLEEWKEMRPEDWHPREAQVDKGSPCGPADSYTLKDASGVAPRSTFRSTFYTSI